MSKTTDVATITVVGLIGVGGYLIFKNKKEIGDFFGGIGDFFGGIPKGIEEGINDFANDPTVKEIDNGLKKGATITNPLTPIKLAGSIFDTIGKGIGDFFGGFNLNFGKSKIDPSDPTPIASKDLPESSKTPLVKQGLREETTMTTKIDTSAYSVDKNGKPLSSIQKVVAAMSGINPENVEIIGRPLTKEEKENREKNPPPTKTFKELAQQDNFIGRVAKTIVQKFNL